MAIISRKRWIFALWLQLAVTAALAQVIFSSSFEYTALVGAEGMTVQTSAPDGTSLLVSFPPGAVFEDTPISIEPVDMAAGELPRFRLRPAGFRFHQDLLVNVVPGSGIDVNDSSVSIESGGERIALPFTVEPGGVIALTLRSFGFDNPTPNKGLGGTFLNLEQIDCQLELTNLNARLEMAMQFKFSVDSVAQLVLQHKAMEQCFLQIDPGALTLVEAAIQQATCEASTEALVDLELDLQFVDDAATMRQRASTVLGSEGSIVYFDAPCATAGQAIPAIESAYQTFSANFRERVASPEFLSGPGAWPAKWSQEFDQAIGLLEDAGLMNLGAVETQTLDFLLPEILDQFRIAAYRACKEDNTQQYLADVKSAGHLYDHPISGTPEVPLWANFSSDDVARDIQYCASQLAIEVFDAVSEPLYSEWVTLDGSGPGEFTHETDLQVPVDGFIDLKGSIYSFFCLGGTGISQYEDQILEVRADDVLLGSFAPQSGLFLTTPVDVSMELVLDQLGISPIADQTFSLEVHRAAAGCQGAYGPSPYELFRANVTTTAPEGVAVAVDMDAELGYWENPHTVAIQVSMPGVADKGLPLGGAAVSLVAMGASIDPVFGVTDAQGRFETTLIIDHQSTEVALTATVTVPDQPLVTVERTASVLRGRVVGVENLSEASVIAEAGSGGNPYTRVEDVQVLSAIPDNFTGFASGLSASATSLDGEHHASANCNFALIFVNGSASGEILSVAATGSATGNSDETLSSATGKAKLRFLFDVVDHPVTLHAAGNMTIDPGRAQDSRIFIYPQGTTQYDGNVLDYPDDDYSLVAFDLDDRAVLSPGRYYYHLYSSASTSQVDGNQVSANYTMNVEFNPAWGPDGP